MKLTGQLSRPGCFALGDLVNHRTGGWWVPQPVSSGSEDKNSSLRRESNPGRQACSLVDILTELPHIGKGTAYIQIRN
jgi:hypothetical protein